MHKAKIGSILEIPTSKGLAYAQYTHQHSQFGGLIRVFDTLFQRRPDDLNSLVRGPVRFSTFFPLKAAVNRGIFKVVGHEEVALANRQFPIFRNGLPDARTKKVAVWWFWDGQKQWKVGAITPEQRMGGILLDAPCDVYISEELTLIHTYLRRGVCLPQRLKRQFTVHGFRYFELNANLIVDAPSLVRELVTTIPL